VIVFIHGGGLLQGDKSIFAGLGSYFVRRGFAAALLNHRLSPAVSHPAHIEDAAAGLAWVYRNVERFGGDPKRIVLMGHSSGAYLAALLALDPRWLGAHDLDSSALRGVVPISGFFDVELLAPSRPMSVWGTDKTVWRAASPLRYVRRDAPPMLLLYADGDDAARRAESRTLEQALSDAGQGAVKSVQIAGRDHRSIIGRFGEREDETASRLLEFARSLVGEPPSVGAR
jgi:acetyl esterase/lipase